MNRWGFYNNVDVLTDTQLSVLKRFIRHEYKALEKHYHTMLNDLKGVCPYNETKKYYSILHEANNKLTISEKYMVLSKGWGLYILHSKYVTIANIPNRKNTLLLMYQDIKYMTLDDTKKYLLGYILDSIDNGNISKVLTTEYFNYYYNVTMK